MSGVLCVYPDCEMPNLGPNKGPHYCFGVPKWKAKNHDQRNFQHHPFTPAPEAGRAGEAREQAATPEGAAKSRSSAGGKGADSVGGSGQLVPNANPATPNPAEDPTPKGCEACRWPVRSGDGANPWELEGSEHFGQLHALLSRVEGESKAKDERIAVLEGLLEDFLRDSKTTFEDAWPTNLKARASAALGMRGGA